MLRSDASSRRKGWPKVFGSAFRHFPGTGSGRHCTIRACARSLTTHSNPRVCSCLIRLRGIAQFRPVIARLCDKAGGLCLEYRDGLLPCENIKLAVGDRPSLRIGIVLFAMRQVDRAIAAELRRIMIGVGD